MAKTKTTRDQRGRFEPAVAVTKMVPTGHRALDRLLGGRGWAIPSVVLLEGVAGCGKTRLLVRLHGVEQCVDNEYRPAERLRLWSIATGKPAFATHNLGQDEDGRCVDCETRAGVALVLRVRQDGLRELRVVKNRFGEIDPDLRVVFGADYDFRLMRRRPRAAAPDICDAALGPRVPRR